MPNNISRCASLVQTKLNTVPSFVTCQFPFVYLGQLQRINPDQSDLGQKIQPTGEITANGIDDASTHPLKLKSAFNLTPHYFIHNLFFGQPVRNTRVLHTAYRLKSPKCKSHELRGECQTSLSRQDLSPRQDSREVPVNVNPFFLIDALPRFMQHLKCKMTY